MAYKFQMGSAKMQGGLSTSNNSNIEAVSNTITGTGIKAGNEGLQTGGQLKLAGALSLNDSNGNKSIYLTNNAGGDSAIMFSVDATLRARLELKNDSGIF